MRGVEGRGVIRTSKKEVKYIPLHTYHRALWHQISTHTHKARSIRLIIKVKRRDVPRSTTIVYSNTPSRRLPAFSSVGLRIAAETVAKRVARS